MEDSSYRFGNVEYNLNERTYIMGVLNITPDSFSDGRKYFDSKVNLDRVIEDAVRMESEGADFLDIGGESTRPGSDTVSLEKELERVIPVISSLKDKVNIPLSIDTCKSGVADEALKAGAVIVNDISGFRFDSKMPDVTARHNASCILMHIKGIPKDMQKDPKYDDVVNEVYNYLAESVKMAENVGIKQIIIDVGIGFGKTLEHNLALIKNLGRFKELGYPILMGLSRKSFLDKIFPTPMDERLEGTIAGNTISIINGANILRVHDVLENKRAARVADRLK